MENIPLLRDIVVLMVVSIPIIILLTRAGLPTVIGFLVAGVLIGPYGLGLVNEAHEVETLSQIGIVLLLFTIGLEFSVTKMLNIRREAVLGGGLQVLLTLVITLVAGLFFDFSFVVSLLLGFVVTLSSTAIVLKLLVDKGQVNTVHGSMTVGILLFQDICVVLMVMVLQSIGSDGGTSTFKIITGLLLSLLAFAIIVAVVAFVIPRIFNMVVKLQNREIFILTILLACLGTAWLTSMFGLSLALGAFIAGLAISESEYSQQIVAEVIPFRDTFASLFFISIGMLLDFKYVVLHLPKLFLLVVAVIALKAIVIFFVGTVLRYRLRNTIVVALSLAQIGEFSFILIKMGEGYGLLGRDLYQSLLAASVITMALTPFIFQWSSKVAASAGRHLAKGGKGAELDGKKEGGKGEVKNHVVIIGYGVNGRHLAQVLKSTSIEHVILDINIAKIRKAKAAGHRAYYGDASHPELLRKMRIAKAKMLVVAISDPITTRRVVKASRRLNPTVSIIVRTRYLHEVEDLYKLGADQVIPEEFETSVEIFARVLKNYRIPKNIIQTQIEVVRQEGYAMLRSASVESERLASLTSVLEESLMETFYVESGCSVAGTTLAELDLRHQTGTSVIAVVRHGTAETNPPASHMIEPGDILVMIGSHSQLNAAGELLSDQCPSGKKEEVGGLEEIVASAAGSELDDGLGDELDDELEDEFGEGLEELEDAPEK
ncbi:MAG: cation:proton antiporter [Proteobacteria bacterium]|nr:cation:proton antiporter [Pseudomonadota bacterium]